MKKPSKYQKKFTNNAGEDIPAFAVLRVENTTDAKLSGTGIKYTVAKPDTSENQVYLVNGYLKVLDGQPGVGMAPEVDDFIVLYDEGDAEAPPTVGEEWGPDESWELKSTGTGFIIVGGAADGRVLARLASSGGGGSIDLLFGRVKEGETISAASSWDIADAGSGTVELLDDDGAVTEEIVVGNRYFNSVPELRPVWVKLIGEDYYLLSAGCGAGPAPE